MKKKKKKEDRKIVHFEYGSVEHFTIFQKSNFYTKKKKKERNIVNEKWKMYADMPMIATTATQLHYSIANFCV